MSERSEGIYFIQKPFTVNTEQMGCYYFNILSACIKAKELGAAIVPPLLPLAPRDNKLVELNSDQPWSASILDFGSVDSRDVIDFSTMKILTLLEFHTRSSGRVNMKHDKTSIEGLDFINDSSSKYIIADLPGRWDTQGNDSHIFYSNLYKSLPLRSDFINEPDWFSSIKVKPFLGVHWRRGDRGNITLGEIGKRLWNSTEPDKVAACINRYIEKNPAIDWIYVSTNSGSDEDRRLLKNLVKLDLYYLDIPPGEHPLNLWEWDLTDLLMCSKASHLLLSPGGFQNSSAFGRLIYAEYLKRNHNEPHVKFMPLI
jgi:hypothetical protein